MEPLNLRSSGVRHSHFRQRSLAAMGIALLGASLGLAGCHSSSQPANAGASASSQKQYSIRGKVVSVDQKDGVIALDTEAIPGVMEAMTMAYTLQNPSDRLGASSRRQTHSAVAVGGAGCGAQQHRDRAAGEPECAAADAIPCATDRRYGSGFSISQPKQSRNFTEAISRQGSGADVYLYPLHLLPVLSADEP